MTFDQTNPEGGLPWHRRVPLFGWFVFFTLLVYARLLYQASFFPPFLEGEEANGLMMAQGLTEAARASGSWWEVLRPSVSEYNKGYGWALIPFYQVFGYDVRVVFVVVSFYVALIGAAFFALYRRLHPRGTVGSYVVITAFPLLALAVRRYKWHSIDYIAALAVYLYFWPELAGRAPQRGDWRWRAGGAALFASACFFYFGAALYIVPWALLVCWYAGRRNRRRLVLAGGLAVGCAGATAWLLYQWNGLWRSRVQVVTKEAWQTLQSPALRVRQASFVEYFRFFSSPPYTVLLVVGLLSCGYHIWRGRAFALVTLAMFLTLWGFEFAIGGINNADQMNWSMIPLLAVLLLGADALLVPLRDQARYGGWIVAVLVAIISGRELVTFPAVNSRFFLQSYISKNNTITQSALLLRELTEHPEANTHYFLPEEAWNGATVGFDYSRNLIRPEYSGTISRLTFFHDEADLRSKVAAAGGARCVAFLNGNLSHDPPNNPDDWTLLGRPGQLVTLYPNIFPFGFAVRKFILN